jgi:hypothetical protein
MRYRCGAAPPVDLAGVVIGFNNQTPNVRFTELIRPSVAESFPTIHVPCSTDPPVNKYCGKC